MGEEKVMESEGLKEQRSSFSLRDGITRCRMFANRAVSTAKVHSPFAQDKLDTVDDAIEGVIHSGYQGLKRIAVNGHPAVILSMAAIGGLGPSIPFGPRAAVRNAGLAVILASIMIYPDHLSRHVSGGSVQKKAA